jgi:hypothetical protein
MERQTFEGNFANAPIRKIESKATKACAQTWRGKGRMMYGSSSVLVGSTNGRPRNENKKARTVPAKMLRNVLGSPLSAAKSI